MALRDRAKRLQLLRVPAYAVAGVAALVLASRHTLPLHGLTVYHVIFRAIETIASFALATL